MTAMPLFLLYCWHEVYILNVWCRQGENPVWDCQCQRLSASPSVFLGDGDLCDMLTFNFWFWYSILFDSSDSFITYNILIFSYFWVFDPFSKRGQLPAKYSAFNSGQNHRWKFSWWVVFFCVFLFIRQLINIGKSTSSSIIAISIYTAF